MRWCSAASAAVQPFAPAHRQPTGLSCTKLVLHCRLPVLHPLLLTFPMQQFAPNSGGSRSRADCAFQRQQPAGRVGLRDQGSGSEHENHKRFCRASGRGETRGRGGKRPGAISKGGAPYAYVECVGKSRLESTNPALSAGCGRDRFGPCECCRSTQGCAAAAGLAIHSGSICRNRCSAGHLASVGIGGLRLVFATWANEQRDSRPYAPR